MLTRLSVLSDSLLWWSYCRVEWWRRVLSKRVTFMGWLVLAMAGLSAGAGTNVAENAIGFLFCLGGIVIAVELGTLFFRRCPVSVQVTAPHTVHAGERVPVQLHVTALKPVHRCHLALYPWLSQVSRQRFISTPEPGEERRNPVDRFLKFYRWKWLNQQRGFSPTETQDLTMERDDQESHALELTFYQRGSWELVDVRAKLVGAFGLFQRSMKTGGQRGTVIVAPRLVPVFLGHNWPGGHSLEDAAHTQPTSGDSQEFLSLRDYHPGDSWRQVNWKALARSGKMMVQEYERPSAPRSTLHWNTSGMSAVEFETAASAVASLAQTLGAKGEAGSVILQHGAQTREYEWLTQSEELLAALAHLDHSLPWESRATSSQAPCEPSVEGQYYYLACAPQPQDCTFLQVEADRINGTPITEGLRL